MALRDWIIPHDYVCPFDPDTTGGVVPGKERIVPYTDTDGVRGSGISKQVYLYNSTGSALVKGAAYIVGYDGDEETNPMVFAYSGAITLDREFVIATSAVPAASFGWFVYAGYANVVLDGGTTDIAKDDYVKMTTAVSNSYPSSDGTATYSADSLGIATAAQTAAASITSFTKVFLIGGLRDGD